MNDKKYINIGDISTSEDRSGIYYRDQVYYRNSFESGVCSALHYLAKLPNADVVDRADYDLLLQENKRLTEQLQKIGQPNALLGCECFDINLSKPQLFDNASELTTGTSELRPESLTFADIDKLVEKIEQDIHRQKRIISAVVPLDSQRKLDEDGYEEIYSSGNILAAKGADEVGVIVTLAVDEKGERFYKVSCHDFINRDDYADVSITEYCTSTTSTADLKDKLVEIRKEIEDICKERKKYPAFCKQFKLECEMLKSLTLDHCKDFLDEYYQKGMALIAAKNRVVTFLLLCENIEPVTDDKIRALAIAYEKIYEKGDVPAENADIRQLKINVFDAINMYRNNGRHPALEEHYVSEFQKYKDAGGRSSLQYFEDNIDEYNQLGHCGY